MKLKLKPVNSKKDIPRAYKGTPIGLLLKYQNLGRPFKECRKAKLLVGMCRRTSSLSLGPVGKPYGRAIGGVRHIVLIGYNHRGMGNLVSWKEDFIKGLINGSGWTRERAEEHFMNLAPMYEIENKIEFSAAARKRYPGIIIAPLYYKLEENKLFCIS